MILHNIVQIAFSDGQGLLITVKDGAWAWQNGWQDSVAWFVCGMFAFLNLPIAGGLTKLAYKNDAPAFALRHLPCRCRSVCLSGGRFDFGSHLRGNAALAVRGQGVFYLHPLYWIIAVLTLPKQLTRARSSLSSFTK